MSAKYVPARSGISVTATDKRQASLARALCRHGYRGTYWFHPAKYFKFLLLDAAGFAASARWGRRGKMARYWRTVGENKHLHEAMDIARKGQI